MLNPNDLVPITMFSSQHFLALATVLSLILLVFLSRKFFMRHRLADKIFRYVLATAIIGSEMGYYVYAGITEKGSLAEMLPIELCGHLLWIISIALYADSGRIARLFFPMAMTGGTLSMLFVNMEASFPHFRAFHYFIIHGGFMIGALYFFFTGKVATYRWKNFGWSCFTLLSMASFMFILNGFHLADGYFLVNPPPGMEVLKEKMGQVGYTLIYMFAIFCIMGIYGFLCYLGTKKRTEEDTVLPVFSECKPLSRFAALSTGKRVVVVFLPVIAFVYLTVLQNMTSSSVLFYVDLTLVIAIFILLIINEISLNYKVFMGNSFQKEEKE